MKHAIAYIDGSGNSGRIQACATTMDIAGIVYERTQILPAHTTNNVGEYSGLLLCLRLAKKLDVGVLEIRSDSQLIVNQTNGKWKCKDPHLQSLRNEALEIARHFQVVSISWVRREENKRADQLCRQAIKQHIIQQTQAARPRPSFLRARPHSLPVAKP